MNDTIQSKGSPARQYRERLRQRGIVTDTPADIHRSTSLDGLRPQPFVLDEVAPQLIVAPDNRCLECHAPFNQREAVVPGSEPVEGSLSLCRSCGAVAIFTANRRHLLVLRRPSAAEAEAIDASPDIAAARSAIIIRRALDQHPAGKKS